MASHWALQYLPDVLTHEQIGYEHLLVFVGSICFLLASDHEGMNQDLILILAGNVLLYIKEHITRLIAYAEVAIGRDFPTCRLVQTWSLSGGRTSISIDGEIEVLTQKRRKVAIIPLSTELRNALEEVSSKRKVRRDEPVLYNPETRKPFLCRVRLYEHAKALGVRASVTRVTPHCFHHTFACDMLARGASIFDVAKMLADTVDTVEKHYAHFVPAARDIAQLRMDNGLAIEERGKMAKTRGKKVAVFPGVSNSG
jgi:hypothetical protein